MGEPDFEIPVGEANPHLNTNFDSNLVGRKILEETMKMQVNYTCIFIWHVALPQVFFT